MVLNRVYACYLITTLLISTFVYTLISTNLHNMKKMERLREEVDDISHLILQTPYNGKAESKYLSDLIDNFIKKRLIGIWDDLYSIKKQIKARDCVATTMQASKLHTKTALEKLEERVNYASEEMGAKIMDFKATPVCPLSALKSWLRLEFNTNPPILMLRPSMEAGNCFGYTDDQATVIVKLSREILIDQVLIQHITKNQSPTNDITSAPKDFQVFGLKNNEEYRLGSFRFDNNQPIQAFPVLTKDRFEVIKFQFDSNHGNPYYTCIYRVGVYGNL